MKQRTLIIIVVLLTALSGCTSKQKIQTLRLATTTSTYDSGLLDVLLPVFEEQFNANLDIIPVGTGQAIALGESQDVDVILVHAREKEEQFITEGYGSFRLDVMYNDFIIVGPPSDPAAISGLDFASQAFTAIYNSQSLFASRGDDSGTHFKEIAIWESTNLSLSYGSDWYKSLGQGMGDTLRFANETSAYTLTDRGTFLSLQDTLPNLVILFGGETIEANPDIILYNPYSVIPVNVATPSASHSLAIDFANWITDIEAQTLIRDFKHKTTGWPLFIPNSTIWQNSQ
jgi:tungstate transport system substrate-binding protein